jgi:ketosteroid isomerase-like protein
MIQSAADIDISTVNRPAILRWMEAFAAAVRARDFAAARALCDSRIVSFGTVAARSDGLDQLESSQWRTVWTATSGFTFDLKSLASGGSGKMIWIAAPWSSLGYCELRASFERKGRATIILRQSGNTLLAVHTHFSLMPVVAVASPCPVLPNAEGSQA